MNNVDKQYLALMQDILKNGVSKKTRAGEVLSVFGRSMSFDLNDGFPLLTTKKVYYKGVIHELIWFLKGDTNIRYLVENNVHIWDDDAYRWFKTLNFSKLKIGKPNIKQFSAKAEKPLPRYELKYEYEITVGNHSPGKFSKVTEDFLKNISKENFIEYVKQGARIIRHHIYKDESIYSEDAIYTFGDLGPVYGAQWRGHGDQINKIIDTLKTNPDDRRMLCMAYNLDVLNEVALPPCHVMFQFYTRELTPQERIGIWYNEHNLNEEVFNYKDSGLSEHTKEYYLFGDYYYHRTMTEEEFIAIIDENYNTPKRELSLSFNMRSQDYCCGWGFNVSSYSLLCHIIANICNMTVGKLVYFGGDIHIYTNQIEGCEEQLKRKGFDELPKLVIKRQLENVDDICYDDFEIVDYQSDPAIKFPLSVG